MQDIVKERRKTWLGGERGRGMCNRARSIAEMELTARKASEAMVKIEGFNPNQRTAII